MTWFEYLNTLRTPYNWSLSRDLCFVCGEIPGMYNMEDMDPRERMAALWRVVDALPNNGRICWLLQHMLLENTDPSVYNRTANLNNLLQQRVISRPVAFGYWVRRRVLGWYWRWHGSIRYHWMERKYR